MRVSRRIGVAIGTGGPSVPAPLIDSSSRTRPGEAASGGGDGAVRAPVRGAASVARRGEREPDVHLARRWRWLGPRGPTAPGVIITLRWHPASVSECCTSRRNAPRPPGSPSATPRPAQRGGRRRPAHRLAHRGRIGVGALRAQPVQCNDGGRSARCRRRQVRRCAETPAAPDRCRGRTCRRPGRRRIRARAAGAAGQRRRRRADTAYAGRAGGRRADNQPRRGWPRSASPQTPSTKRPRRS